jgi:diguanylate cyclase (GGDEF)-like protein/putative nucleotidyltransferase with HDIG domain
MEPRAQLPLVGRLYVLSIVSAGTLVLLYSAHQLVVAPPLWTWLILAAFTLVSGTLTIKVPTITAKISVSEMFVFTAVLLYGTAPATIIVALDGLVLSVSSRSRRVDRVLFNVAEPSLSIWLASHLFFALAGIKPLSLEPQPVDVVSLLVPLGVLTVAYFLLNSWLTATAIGLEQGKSPVTLWRKHFIWLSLNYFGGASVAVLLVRGSARNLDAIGFAVILPLLLISYLTHKYSMGRLEDASRHITQLNSLYLSTIETLAMAIDAKDQITHGHIRRVQLYAVGLAKALGVHEEPLIRAIEAAALLHDTGKLAVPEYILNKPGRLTPAEFEKMKLHATVGANILSSIDFPYPVVPIVRHHHENWDGTGYPDGVKGPDIPIGARILAVADCFDALTSDRPYRPKLPDADAIQILVERRGTMYDPLVVDTFVAVHAELGRTEAPEAQPDGSALREIAQSSRIPWELPQATSLDDIAASSEEMLALYDLARALGGHTSLADAGDIIAKHLRRILPASMCVFYVFDASCDELVAAHVAGPDPLPVAGLRIPLGERIGGWVAANRRTILNSDPVLDFGDLARTARPRLRSCLSTPLIADEGLVGVLTLYAADANAFTEDHLRIVEAVGRQISRVVRDSAQFERRHSALRDAVTGLPNLERLKQLTPADVGLSPETAARPLSLLFLDVDRLKQVNQQAGRDAGDAVLAHVARAIRRVLRGADILFRYADDEFVVLLSQTDSETAYLIASRVRAVLAASPYQLPDGRPLPTFVTIGIATHPIDGTSLTDLIAVARHRLIPGPTASADIAPGIH